MNTLYEYRENRNTNTEKIETWIRLGIAADGNTTLEEEKKKLNKTILGKALWKSPLGIHMPTLFLCGIICY